MQVVDYYLRVRGNTTDELHPVRISMARAYGIDLCLAWIKLLARIPGVASIAINRSIYPSICMNSIQFCDTKWKAFQIIKLDIN